MLKVFLLGFVIGLITGHMMFANTYMTEAVEIVFIVSTGLLLAYLLKRLFEAIKQKDELT